MNRKERLRLFGICVNKWGQDAQIDMCIEEMAELTKALCKAKRHKRSDNWLASVYEEIADVTIMLEQIVIIFDGELVVPLEIEEKLKRLQEEVQKK